MIKSILLCTDGSPYAMVATEYSLWLAKRLGAALRVVHVTDIRILDWPFLADLSGSIGAQPYMALLPQIQRLHEEKAHVILDVATRLANERGVSCSTVHKTGSLVDSILEEEKRAELVVLGQRGEHARHTGDMMGSAVERIVRRSIKPCLVTPAKFMELNRMLVAYDGSNSSNKSLEQGIELAQELKLPLTILTVVAEDSTVSATVQDEAASLARKHGLNPRTELVSGHAEAEILGFAEREQMNLIVMGAYGHARLREFMLGSTTSHVIRKSSVPVLLTR